MAQRRAGAFGVAAAQLVSGRYLLQLALDMALAQTAPIGFGHVYAPQDYFDGWVAVTEPQGFSDAELDALEAKLTRHGPRALIEGGWFRHNQPVVAN